jgi:DNA-binding transcriptional MerR regulator
MSSTGFRNGWRVSELAAGFGVRPRTIRYYDRVGLLVPAGRTAAGYRVYGTGERDRLRFILKAKASGLTLAEIRELLSLRQRGIEPCDRLVAVVDEKLRELKHQMRSLRGLGKELGKIRREALERQPREACVCSVIEHHEASHRPESLQLASELLSHRRRRR